VNTQRVSEAEEEVSAMLVGYDLGGSDRYEERSPPKLELVSEYRHPHHSPPTSYPTHAPAVTHAHHLHPPPLTLDISSDRFQPVSVMAQAARTSTYRHPRLNWPETAKVNIYIRVFLSFTYMNFYYLYLNSRIFSYLNYLILK